MCKLETKSMILKTHFLNFCIQCFHAQPTHSYITFNENWFILNKINAFCFIENKPTTNYYTIIIHSIQYSIPQIRILQDTPNYSPNLPLSKIRRRQNRNIVINKNDFFGINPSQKRIIRTKGIKMAQEMIIDNTLQVGCLFAEY